MAKKRRKSRKKSIQSNTSLAKRQRAITKALSNKEQNQSKDLTFWQKIVRYKKWFSSGVFSLLFTLYITFYPQNIVVTDRLLGKHNEFSNPVIIFNNPNSYMIDNVKVKVDLSVDLVANDGFAILDDIGFKTDKTFFEIKSKKSGYIKPGLTEGLKINSITKCDLRVISSFETLFIYPDIKNDTTSYIGVLKPNGDVDYLPN